MANKADDYDKQGAPSTSEFLQNECSPGWYESNKDKFYITPMAYYVCSGAKLKCSMGSKQSELEVVHIGNPVLLCGSPMNITCQNLIKYLKKILKKWHDEEKNYE